MTPIDFACPHTDPSGWNCGAAAGERCRFPDYRATPIRFHAARIALANMIGNGEEVSPQEFQDAVDRSGLV